MYSKGVVCLGLNNVMKFMKEFYDEFGKLKTISIGSGDGVLEDDIKKRFEVDMVKIEPDGGDYADIKEYIGTSKDDDCLMFINWPYPTGSSNTYENYDIIAIQALHPKYVIAIVDSTGGAGSKSFLNMIANSGLDIELYLDEVVPCSTNYVVIRSIRKKYIHDNIMGNNQMDIVLLVRKDYAENLKVSHEILPSERISDNCNIM